MASIETRVGRDGKPRYRVKVRLRGYPVETATFDRKTDAKRWAQDTESAMRNDRYFHTSEAKRHTLGELIDRFIQNELPKLPRVEPLMSSQLRWWKRRLGYKALSEVRPADIAECRDRLLTEGTPRKRDLSPATVNRYLAALSIAFSAAVKEWGWLESSPMRRVRKLKEPRERVRFLSDDERDRLLSACQGSTSPFLYPIVVLALSTGARRSEILGLRWSDVNLKRGLITLEETKNGERRSLPLRGLALALIGEHAKVRRLDTDLLFPSRRHASKPASIRDPWVKALKAAGINDFRFHDLRHSAASYLAMSGASSVEIAAVLGHKTLQMVKRYAHLSDAHTAELVARMNEKLFGCNDA